MIDTIEMVGIFAGFCTTLSFVPQISKVVRTKSTKDISLYMYLIYITGLVFWIFYGVLISSFSLMLANTTTLILASSILFLKLRWDHLKTTNN